MLIVRIKCQLHKFALYMYAAMLEELKCLNVLICINFPHAY